MSKEVILKLIELSQKIEAKSLTFLLCRQNKEFIKFFQGMLTAGFQQNKELSQTIIDGKKYKILTMYMSALDGEIEEIGF
ncbi:MAG: hypothetical protein MJ252_29000 [archaeon]|nr:hypothetical protein [archaeon]